MKCGRRAAWRGYFEAENAIDIVAGCGCCGQGIGKMFDVLGSNSCVSHEVRQVFAGPVIEDEFLADFGRSFLVSLSISQRRAIDQSVKSDTLGRRIDIIMAKIGRSLSRGWRAAYG